MISLACILGEGGRDGEMEGEMEGGAQGKNKTHSSVGIGISGRDSCLTVLAVVLP